MVLDRLVARFNSWVEMARRDKAKAKNLVLDVYKDSRTFYQDIRNRMDEYWRMSRGQPLTKKKKFNRFIPYVPAAIDLVLPRLAGRLPVFEVTGRTQDDHEHSKTMNDLVKYFLDKVNFHDIELKAIKSMLVYGSALVQVGWDFKKMSVHEDVKEKTGEDTQVVKDQPMYTIVPIENVYPHRNKVHIQDEWPIIIREEVSRRDLKNDPNIDNSSLSKVGEALADEEFFDQTNRRPSRDNSNSNPTDVKDNDVLIKLTYWGPFDIDGDGNDEECVITVVNGEAVVRLEQNPFWHQRKPFAKFDYVPDAEQFFSDSMVTQLKDLQLELNELRNMRSEARKLALQPAFLIDRGAGVDLDNFKMVPGATLGYDPTVSPNPIRAIEVPDKLFSLDREETAVKGDMQLRSGINDVVVGQEDVGVAGGKTATGAAIAAEQVSLRFKTQAILIDQAIKELGEQTIQNIQQYVDQDMAFKIAGDDGFEWRDYQAEIMRQFEFDFMVSPMSTFVEPKAAKRDKLIAVKQLYDQDPRIDQGKLDRMLLEAFDLDPEQIMRNEEELQQEQLALQLQQLATQIESPQFQELPPEEQDVMLNELRQLQAQVEGGEQGTTQNQLPPGL